MNKDVVQKVPENKEVAIRINNEHCSKCGICRSVCPFEAIAIDKTTGEFRIEIEKCQVCGLCSSACPSAAIELSCYSYNSLIDYITKQIKTSKAKTLVAMCRGSSPSVDEIPEILKEQKVDKFIPLCVPCVGRLPADFYLKTLALGIEKIIAIQCDEKFCRYKKGSQINIHKVVLLQTLLEQFGYKKDVLKVIKNPLKAVYKTDECVGCDKCEFICPYDAIELQPIGTPEVKDACKGCGICSIICPHLAIQIKGFEYENTLQKIQIEAKKKVGKGILVFCCQWAEFSALEKLNGEKARENVFIIEIPCLGKLDSVQVLQALSSGFAGVMAFGCSADDCKMKEGRGTADQNISALKDVLTRLNLADRFEVCYGSPRYVGDFDAKLDSFIAKIAKR
jgi:coenzyme F420-reducing hydrogenase delta subunit/ferredoxin